MWGVYSSVGKLLPRVHKALGSVPSCITRHWEMEVRGSEVQGPLRYIASLGNLGYMKPCLGTVNYCYCLYNKRENINFVFFLASASCFQRFILIPIRCSEEMQCYQKKKMPQDYLTTNEKFLLKYEQQTVFMCFPYLNFKETCLYYFLCQ